MPALNTERRTTSRSALRHRPIDTVQTPVSPVISRAHRSHRDGRAPVAPAPPDALNLEEEKRLPYRRPTASNPPRQPVATSYTRHRLHPLFFIGIGLLLTALLWIGITQAMTWGSNELNTLRYGYPRTFQIDAVISQGDSAQHPSHFVAINLHGIVTIIDFPAGDPSRAREIETFSVLGPDADQVVVTLRFIDLSHNGKPDLLIDVSGIQSFLVNDGKTFHPPTPTEQQQLLQELRNQ